RYRGIGESTIYAAGCPVRFQDYEANSSLHWVNNWLHKEKTLQLTLEPFVKLEIIGVISSDSLSYASLR
ncbi:MAG: hypothetical protein MUO17_05310, partial [Dehalococcoidales bacterium]|nr:hypothetical protein [Dehalococcoidales bacterium]